MVRYFILTVYIHAFDFYVKPFTKISSNDILNEFLKLWTNSANGRNHMYVLFSKRVMSSSSVQYCLVIRKVGRFYAFKKNRRFYIALKSELDIHPRPEERAGAAESQKYFPDSKNMDDGRTWGEILARSFI